MSSATVAATDNRTRCDAIRHWLTPHRLHCIVLAAYVIVVGTVMCFHEPWFDEAQAWLIARDCSWREMILERPHYEGHPPLWWMMLAAPAKLGVPYEIGLKSINLTCATLMIWLLEFKTKLPEPFKVILPFSYFLCYQYGVTSRPYALMVAAMLLVAINWKTRDEKPWREALSMMLLCLTSSYELVIAGMFAANWVVRFVWQEHSLIRNRRRFIALLALLAAAMAILIDVMPAKDVYSGNFDISNRVQKFVDCRSKDVEKREIYIVEGDSALGSVKLSRDAVGHESGIHRPITDTAVHGNRVMPHVGPAHPHQPTSAQRNAAAELVHSDVLGVRAAFLYAPSGHPAGILHRGARD